MVRVIPKMDVWKMGFIFCGKYTLPMTRAQVRDPGPIVWKGKA